MKVFVIVLLASGLLGAFAFSPQHEIFVSGVSVGPLGSAPAVAVDPIDNQLVFWHGATNASMWKVYYDGSWHGPVDRGVGPLA